MDEYQLDMFKVNPAPCPFCGKTPLVKYDILKHAVYNDCCVMRFHLFGNDVEEFIAAWNDRK